MSPLEGNGLDQALARAGDGVTVVGPDGRIVLWNRAAERILGYTTREATGKLCCDIFVGRDDDGNRLCYQGCHVMTLVGMGEPIQSFDMCTQNKAGQRVWLSMSIFSLGMTRRENGRDANGFVVHLFRDVTATKELLTLVHQRLSAATDNGKPMEMSGSLTRRELDVLRLLATGANTKASAERLHVSPATIRNHVQNIFGKLGVHSRLEAVAQATRHRLL